VGFQVNLKLPCLSDILRLHPELRFVESVLCKFLTACSLSDMPSGILIAFIILAVLASSLFYLVKGEGGVEEAWQQLKNGYEALVEG